MKVETAINDKNIDLITKQRFQFGGVKLQQAIDQPSSQFNPIPEVLETNQEEIAAWRPDTSRISFFRKKVFILLMHQVFSCILFLTQLHIFLSIHTNHNISLIHDNLPKQQYCGNETDQFATLF